MSLADYRRVKQVGQGGFGDAYLVELNSDRTIKFVLKEMTYTTKDEKKDCLAEVEMLRQLDHPHIVAFRDSFSNSNTVYLVMEFCPGGDLGQYLKAQDNHLSEQRIISWTLQILQALQYLHGRPKPVLHRDMKPGNIFLTDRNSVKIGDFGISRELVSPMDLAQTFCGTPLYLAPEIYRQEPYDHKCDIWSLGCCVYEMMTLKPAVNPLLLGVLNIVSINPMPSNYSDALVNIVQQMMTVDTSARPSAAQSIGEVRALLHQLRQDSPNPGFRVDASPPSSPSSSPSSSPAPLSAGPNFPVDSLLLHKNRHLKGSGPAAAAVPDDLEDEYDLCLNYDDDDEETIKNNPIPIKTAAWRLMNYGYKFNNSGRLVDKTSGGGFKYDVFPKKSDNEERYREIAKAVIDHVYDLLESKLGMQRVYLPIDHKAGEPWTFVYVTLDIFSNADKLLLLIGGAGPIRAGIWSRKAVINDSIDAGSQIPVIREASRNGYAVLILNQNQTYLEVDGYRVQIRDNRTDMEHTLYVWDKLITNNTKVKHIAIMAHSEGTEIASKLAVDRKDSFMRLVFAVALCHPRKEDLLQNAPKDVVDLFATHSRTWVASKKPLDEPIKKTGFTAIFSKDKNVEHSAGDERPEWTAFTSKNSAFEFIQKQYKKRPAV